MQRLLGFAFILIIGREAFAGAARYYLDRVGLGAAWFLADLALMVAVAFVILNYLRHNTEDRYLYATLIIVFFVSLGMFSGYARGNNTSSMISAVKIAMPLVATVIVYPRYLETTWFRTILAILFLMAVAGVFYNRTTEVPWAGYSISQFGVTRTASRLWWAAGESRIAGFGQASGATANIILVMTLLLARGNQVPLKVVIYALGLGAVYVTTSRTPLIALSIGALVDLWPRRLGKEQNYDRPLLALFFIVATLVPVAYSMIVVFGDEIARYRMSILDRLHYTWPSVLSMTYDSGWTGFVFGQGFGSIGSPAYYSGRYVSPVSAVDNFFLYMFAIYGTLSLVMGLLIFLCFMSIPWRDRYFAFAACLMMATISCEGIGGSLLVGYSIAFGLAALGPRTRFAPGPEPYRNDAFVPSGA